MEASVKYLESLKFQLNIHAILNAHKTKAVEQALPYTKGQHGAVC